MASGNDKAAKQARQAEAERQAAIRNTQNAVNRVFDSPGRQGEINDVVAAVREKGLGELNEEKGNTDRALKFALARGGLIGGSTQLDQQRDVAKAYGKGLLEVDRQSLGVGADLQSRDQEARSRLISLATSGLDATTAASQAAAALRTNLEAGRAAATVQGIGDTFASFSKFAERARDAQQRRQALYDANRNLYGPSSATSFAYGGGQ